MKSNLIPWRRKRKATDLPVTAQDHPLANLYQRINDLFAEFFDGDGGLMRTDSAFAGSGMLSMPTFDVAETDKAVEVRAELPGLDEKDIEVTLDENILTIRGEKKQEHSEKKKNCYLSECRYGAFQRAVSLEGLPHFLAAGYNALRHPVRAAMPPDRDKRRVHAMYRHFTFRGSENDPNP